MSFSQGYQATNLKYHLSFSFLEHLQGDNLQVWILLIKVFLFLAFKRSAKAQQQILQNSVEFLSERLIVEGTIVVSEIDQIKLGTILSFSFISCKRRQLHRISRWSFHFHFELQRLQAQSWS